MNTCLGNLRSAYIRTRHVLLAEPRILTIAASLGVFLFLLAWVPHIGEYLLTDGWRTAPPRLVPAVYRIAYDINQFVYYYFLAFTLAGLGGYLVARAAKNADGPAVPPAAAIARHGLRSAHWLLLMFVIVGIVSSLIILLLLSPYFKEGLTMEQLFAQLSPGVRLFLAVYDALWPHAVKVFILLWVLELVRGRGWSKAGWQSLGGELQRADVLFVCVGFTAIDVVITRATAWLHLPSVGGSPLTVLPLALLLVAAEAVLVPLTLQLLIELGPAAIPAASGGTAKKSRALARQAERKKK